MNKGIIIIITFLSLITIIDDNKTSTQMVAPACFEKQDCAIPIQQGYCGVDYDCIVGKCYSRQILCPEECIGKEDEDMDGKIDCDDEDCFDSPYCHCSKMSFGKCIPGRCYCQVGIPHWVVLDEDSWCECR